MKLLGQGGESKIFRIDPYVPLEIIAKTPLVDKEDNFRTAYQFNDLLMEDHIIKMVAHKNYVA